MSRKIEDYSFNIRITEQLKWLILFQIYNDTFSNFSVIFVAIHKWLNQSTYFSRLLRYKILIIEIDIYYYNCECLKC